jgi:hypothetical protein
MGVSARRDEVFRILPGNKSGCPASGYSVEVLLDV